MLLNQTCLNEELYTAYSNIYIYMYSCYFEQVSLDIQQLAHLKLLDEIDVFLCIMSLKQMQNQNIFSNLKYPTGFDKVIRKKNYFLTILPGLPVFITIHLLADLHRVNTHFFNSLEND